MTLARLVLSAVGFLAAANAHPHPAGMEARAEPTTTTTMYARSTVTQVVSRATSTGSSSEVLPGVSYAPYTSSGGCKTQAQISSDFARLNGGYALVRTYGTDCGQIPMVYTAAKANGMKVFFGIYDIDQVPAEANLIISGVDGDWSDVDTVSVGNELVNSGQATPAQVNAAVSQARTLLRAAGYTGPVVSVDTFTATEANPELCTESDYCAINAHAFFDPTVKAFQAGKWLANTVADVRSAIGPSKRIVVTESGWPTQGMTNGLAVPGIVQQRHAVNSIKRKFKSNMADVILFSAYDDLWKTKAASTFDADQYWGLDGAISSSDQ